MHGIDSKFVTGPENILVQVCVDIPARKIDRLG